MGINRFFRSFRDDRLQDAVAGLCSDIAALRDEAAQMAASVFDLREQQAELAKVKGDVAHLADVAQMSLEQTAALSDTVDGMEERLSDIALAHLTQTGGLQAHVDMRLDLVGDTALATLAEVSRLRHAMGQGGNSDRGGAASSLAAQGHGPNRIAPDEHDALGLATQERQSLLVLSSFFNNLVK